MSYHPAAKLAGKIALVTGASKGIGAQIAKTFAAEGASVVVNYASSRAGADRVVSEIQSAGGRALAVQADLAREPDVRRLFAETKSAFGGLDILVNNAGVYEFKPLAAITAQDFHKMFDLNVLGLLLACREAAALMGEKGGSIINISSLVARLALPASSIYSATKAAVDSITRVLSAELGPKHIRVNSINPGVVATEGNAEMASPDNDFRKMVEARTPLGRIGQVDDIAPAAVFFASDDSKWITGESLHIAGGYS